MLELLSRKPLICRVSSVVEQRFCKPLVGSSNLSPGTKQSNLLRQFPCPQARSLARRAPSNAQHDQFDKSNAGQ
jgi:hypothetical protein